VIKQAYGQTKLPDHAFMLCALCKEGIKYVHKIFILIMAKMPITIQHCNRIFVMAIIKC